jgi:cobalt-zinc-cadmium efflux system outer membrane protein
MGLPLLLLCAQLGGGIVGNWSLAADAAARSGEASVPLSAAVAQARAASPRRRAAFISAEGIREAVRFAGRPPNPLFELRTENWNFSGQPSSPAIDVFAVLTQPIELGGKRDIRQQLASTDSDIAAGALKSLEREIALETARAYVRSLKAKSVLETLTANRDGLTMIVTSVGRRVDEGYSPEADLLKFKTEAARVDGDIARARLELERSLAALTIAMGGTAPIRAAQLVEPSPISPPAADTGTIAASVARHPDVVKATATVSRAEQIVRAEQARGKPDALVTGGYKRTEGFDTLVLGAAIALPFLERNDAAIARSVGAARAAGAERDALLQRLSLEADALVRAAQTITDQAAKAPQELLEPAEDVRRAALAAFREGTADVMKLIDAERVYADVNRAAIELRLDALLTTIEARFAIGEETIP